MFATLWTVIKYVILLGGSAVIAAWAGLTIGAVESTIALWATGWLVGLRTDAQVRHRHVLLLLGFVALALVYAGAIWWLLTKYVAAAAWATAKLGPALQVLGVALPSSPTAAVPTINAAFLVLCVAVKLAALSPLGLPGIGNSGLMEGLARWAHRRRAAGWLLKPWWVTSRMFGVALTLLGLTTLAVQWWVLPDAVAISWLSLMASALIPIGIEWYFWLSSDVDHQLEAEFGGRDQPPPLTEALFEDLWRRYRRIWPMHWTAAGNQAPERRDG
jgi:hypothetical protein